MSERDDEALAAAVELSEQLPADELPDDADTTPPSKPRRQRRSSTPRKRAPRKAAGDKADKAPSRPRAPRATPLGKRVADLHTTVALGMSMAPAPWAQPTAMALATQAADIGKAWEQLARENPRVAEALERVLTVSTLGTLVGAYVPVVLAGLAASGKLPAQLGGQVVDDAPAPAPADDEQLRPAV